MRAELFATVAVAAYMVMLSGAVASDKTRWGYEGDNGPAQWGALDATFSACAGGTAQSPIDLVGAETRDLTNIEFDYVPSPLVILNNGHTIQVNVAPGSSITLDDVRYELLQFHFHHGSEHTVAGVRFPLELHLVHRAEEGALAVVGVLLQEGSANETLTPLWPHLPARPTPATAVPDVVVDVAALLPELRTTWRYAGSLTTPPCTEGVRWLVMTEPVALSAEQIASYAALFSGSYRPVQPLNGRSLIRDVETQ